MPVCDSNPVFVVGMNGSGTTMLLDNLGNHPDLYAFPRETRLIPYLFARQKQFGDLKDDENFLSLWKAVLNTGVFAYVNNHQPPPLPDNWAAYPRSLAAVLDGVFKYFAGKDDKQRWCEKTPQYIQHMPLLLELFPEAKFIHVVRDGRDCAASFNRRWLRTPELTMYRWKKVVNQGHEVGVCLGSDKYMEIRYEDLTADPDKWLPIVCDFIDLPFDEAVMRSSQPYLKGEGGTDKKPASGGLVPNSGNWKNYFSTPQIARLEQIGGATLAQFGYEARDPEGNSDLSGLKRKTYQGRDALAQYLREIGLKLSGKIERPWKVILGRPLVAWRQRGQNRY